MLCLDCQKFDGILVVRDMLLCKECAPKHLAGINQSVAALENHRRELQTIRHNGDVYNSELSTLPALKQNIFADESIKDKNASYQRAVLERIEHLKIAAFQKEEVIRNEQKELQAIKIRESALTNHLRDFGNDLRTEIRAKMKELDDQYQPIIVKKPVIAKVTKKLSAFDKVIQQVALARNIQFDEAKKLIEGNPALMSALVSK